MPGKAKPSSSSLPPDPQFISRIRAAEMLDCSPQTIDKFVKNKQLRAFHIGRKVVVRQDELLKLMEANEIQ